MGTIAGGGDATTTGIIAPDPSNRVFADNIPIAVLGAQHTNSATGVTTPITSTLKVLINNTPVVTTATPAGDGGISTIIRTINVT